MSKPSNMSLEYAKECISRLIIYEKNMISNNKKRIIIEPSFNNRNFLGRCIILREEHLKSLELLLKEIS